jgi:PPP family 3-phenylpropionic acid transporter
VRNHNRAFYVPKLYYLLFFGAIGALAPFFNIYLQQRGLSGMEIGLLGSLAPLVALAANPFWGAIADRFCVHRRVLAGCVFAAGLLSIPFLFVNGFLPILLVNLLLIFFRAPVPALLDTAVMGMIAGGGASYGRQRLFGSLGFLLTSFGLGRVMAPDSLGPIFWVHGALLAVGCTILSLRLPFPDHKGAGERGAGEKAPGMWRGLRLMAGQRRYMSFLAMSAFLGFGAACFSSFVGLRLLSLGGTNSQVGLAFALNALTEIPIMYMGARLSRRFGQTQLMLTGVLGLAAAYALAGIAQTPLLVLGAMAMIGVFNGAYWSNVVVFATESVPPHLRATGLSLVGAAQGGLGWALGGITGGVLWDAFGGTVVLLTGAASLLVGAAIFALGQRGAQQGTAQGMFRELAPGVQRHGQAGAPLAAALGVGTPADEPLVGESLS